MGFRARESREFRVRGVGLRVWELGFRACGIQGLEFRVQATIRLGFRALFVFGVTVKGSGFMLGA